MSFRQCLVFNNETISRLTSEVNCEKNLCSIKQDMKARFSFFNTGLKSDLRDDTIPAAVQHHHTFLNIFSNQIHQFQNDQFLLLWFMDNTSLKTTAWQEEVLRPKVFMCHRLRQST